MSPTTTGGSLITEAQRKQFQEEGYFLLERVIAPAQIEALRGEAARFIEMMYAEMDKVGTDTFGISHRNKTLFRRPAYQRKRHSERVRLRRPDGRHLSRHPGEDAYFFLDQFVVKAAEIGMSFGWHQDGGYVGHPHRNYTTCWATP